MRRSSIPYRLTLRLLLVTSLLYLALVALLVVGEPVLVYRPLEGPVTPEEAGLLHFTRKTITHEGLPPIHYWENTVPHATATVLYFHGNGGGLHYHAPNLAYFDNTHVHVIAVEYPGYPGAEGLPSEPVIVAQANALYEFVKSQHPRAPIVIWGYSLGSGVATQLAARHHPAVLILEAPFTAVVDRAAEIFPFIPVHSLMKDQYRSRDVIAQIHAPLFIMHGTDDIIIPIHHGRDLFALANSPKLMKEYKGFGHLDLLQSGAYDDARAFISTQLDAAGSPDISLETTASLY